MEEGRWRPTSGEEELANQVALAKWTDDDTTALFVLIPNHRDAPDTTWQALDGQGVRVLGPDWADEVSVRDVELVIETESGSASMANGLIALGDGSVLAHETEPGDTLRTRIADVLRAVMEAEGTDRCGAGPRPQPIRLATAEREGKSGRGTRTRTRDLRIWNPLLYQLSYTPKPRSAYRGVQHGASRRPRPGSYWRKDA